MAYIPPYYYPQPPMNIPQQNPNPTQILQSNSFVSVRSELEARNFPVGYGNSVTFKDENAPYVYTKTMGFSQLDTPKFEKYKLVKEEPQAAQIEPFQSTQDNLHSYAEKSDLDAVWSEIEAIKKIINKKEVNNEDE